MARLSLSGSVFAVICMLTACGPSSPSQMPVDAGSSLTMPHPDASPAGTNCLIPSSYAALGNQTGQPDVTAPDSITVTLAAGPPADELNVSLDPSQGAFAAGGIQTGAFTISGDDAGFTTCGLCISLLAHVDPTKGAAKLYFADAGSVQLTTAIESDPSGSPKSEIAGTATNVHLTEIDLAATGGPKPVPNGCTTTIASITFMD
jgi:hypothetical protein